MTTLELQPAQARAFMTRATEVLYGGSAGGGKSHLIRAAFIAWATMIPGLQLGLFRRMYPDLRANHMEGPTSFPVMLAPYVNAGHARIVRDEITFWNGSRISLNHCQHDKDMFRYQGAEFHVLGFDELTHFSETQYRFLRGRVRMTGLNIPPHLRGLFPRIISGSNPGGIGHCVKFGEVWTDKGWRDIWDIKVGDMVYSRNHDGELVLKRVAQTHRTRAENVLRFERRGLTIEATADHKIGTLREGKHLALVPMSELPGQAYIARSAEWKQGGISEVQIEYVWTGKRRNRLNQPLKVTGSQYAALAGWTLAEGCVGKYNSEWRWTIAQSKKEHRATIAALLTECGLKFQTGNNGFTMASESWAKHWLECGDKSRWKRVPPLLLRDANEEQARIFVEAAVCGDGHWSRRSKSGQFYTGSAGLADDFQIMAMKAGFVTYLSHRERENRIGQCYCVNFRQPPKLGYELLTGNHLYKVTTKTKRAEPAKKLPGGLVCCIGVEETHNFFIRQNGSVWISGNCWVKKTFVDHGEMILHRAAPEEGGMIRQYIPARLSDNPALMKSDPDYITRLAGLGDATLVRAMMDGDWSIVAGAMFGEEWRAMKESQPWHVCDPFAIPIDWPIWRGADDGYAAPACCVWGTQNPTTKTVYVCGELHAAKMLPEVYAKRTAAIDYAIPRWYPTEKEVRPNIEKITGELDCAAFSDTGHDIIRGHAINKKLIELGAGKFGEVEKWDGSRVHGVQNFHRLLAPNPLDPRGLPGIRFFKNCRHCIEEIPALPRDPKKPEDVDTSAPDHCFVAGTMIATTRGQIAIEKLRPGDMVWTRLGAFPVIGTWSRLAPVIDNIGLTGTPDHKIWTDEEWKELAEAMPSDTFCTWRNPSFTFTRALNIDVTRIRPGEKAGYIFSLQAEESACTLLFGKKLTGQYPRVVTSTIGTKTRSTTQSKIWSASHQQITRKNILRAGFPSFEKISSSPAPPPWLGIADQRAEYGIQNTLLRLPEASLQSLTHAIIAEPDSHPRGQRRDFAQTIARQISAGKAGLMTSTKPAQFAGEHFAPTNTRQRRLAGNRVERVYNISVAGPPEYFANGILVSNCWDAVRYLLQRKFSRARRLRTGT